MKKSELKEIIRKELGLTEGLFMGPSKGKSKPKTVNVRHKTSGKELVIRDNPANIKKYKRLGYTMWVGSRGKYESVNDRQTLRESGDEKQKIIKYLIKKGANPKEAKKDVDKQYDYVSKKYKNAPLSKKAEVIVTLAGSRHPRLQSEGILTEKEAPYSEAELKKVAQFTDRNDHILARHYIAKNGSYEVLRKAYQALHDLQSALGHSPRGADKIISDLDKDLKKYIKKDVPNWEEVWKRL